MLSAIAVIGFFAAGCSRAPVHVIGPFYLQKFVETDDIYLFRCPDGPQEGCAVDGLPGPRIVGAGGNDRYVVVAQADPSNADVVRYFYFARVPQETRGWASNPEKIIGPLTALEFDNARKAMNLPAADVRP